MSTEKATLLKDTEIYVSDEDEKSHDVYIIRKKNKSSRTSCLKIILIFLAISVFALVALYLSGKFVNWYKGLHFPLPTSTSRIHHNIEGNRHLMKEANEPGDETLSGGRSRGMSVDILATDKSSSSEYEYSTEASYYDYDDEEEERYDENQISFTSAPNSKSEEDDTRVENADERGDHALTGQGTLADIDTQDEGLPDNHDNDYAYGIYDETDELNDEYYGKEESDEDDYFRGESDEWLPDEYVYKEKFEFEPNPHQAENHKLTDKNTIQEIFTRYSARQEVQKYSSPEKEVQKYPSPEEGAQQQLQSKLDHSDSRKQNYGNTFLSRGSDEGMMNNEELTRRISPYQRNTMNDDNMMYKTSDRLKNGIVSEVARSSHDNNDININNY